MTAALDTNCLLRWVIGDVPSQADLVDNFLKKSGNRAHVADMAVAEMVWVLEKVYQLDRLTISRSVRSVIDNPVINCNKVMLAEAASKYPTQPTLSFVDICLALYVKFSEAEALLTFDKKLAKKMPTLASELS